MQKCLHILSFVEKQEFSKIIIYFKIVRDPTAMQHRFLY